MEAVFITVTGMNYRYGNRFVEPGMKVKLVKEPDNEVDSEAIRVEMRGLGTVGYVANSPHTVVGESISAGRLYDKIRDIAFATVLYRINSGLLCEVDSECLAHEAE